MRNEEKKGKGFFVCGVYTPLLSLIDDQLFGDSA